MKEIVQLTSEIVHRLLSRCRPVGRWTDSMDRQIDDRQTDRRWTDRWTDR